MESRDRRWSWKTELEDGNSQVDASAAGGGLADSLSLKLKSKEPKGFDMDQYIEEQSIGFLLSNKPINIEVLFEASSGFHLTETPISKNQKLNQLESGKFLLKASLANTEQLRWWLLGFGNRVEVLKPKSLRNEFSEIAKGLSKIYN